MINKFKVPADSASDVLGASGLYAQLRLLRMLACCAELAASTSTHLVSTGLPYCPTLVKVVNKCSSATGNQNNNRKGAPRASSGEPGTSN
jgi:hypothetical protein